MRPLVGRELGVVARCPALVVSVVVHVAVMAAFVLAWADRSGVAVADGTFYQDARLLQSTVLAVLLPWTAARCVADESGDDLVLFAAATAARPSQLVLARACAGLVSLSLLVATGLPMAVLAQRISAVPAARLIVDQAAMLSLPFISCAAVLGWRHACRSRFLGWLGAEASVLLLVLVWLLASSGFVVPLAGAACLAAITIWLLGVRSDRSFRYLSEHHA